MNGYELLVPYLIADRLERAEADRLAKAAKQPELEVDEAEAANAERTIYRGEPWVPALRGYPCDPEFGR